MNSLPPEAASQNQSSPPASQAASQNQSSRPASQAASQNQSNQIDEQSTSDPNEPVSLSQKSVEEIPNEPIIDNETVQKLRRSTILQRLSRPVQQLEFPTPDFKRYQENVNSFVPSNLGRFQK